MVYFRSDIYFKKNGTTTQRFDKIRLTNFDVDKSLLNGQKVL